MSKFIVDAIESKSGEMIEVQGNLAITGRLNGIPVSVLTGGTGFTGNTSGNCITQAHIDTIYGANTDLVNSPNLLIGTNTVVNANVTANYLYGDGSNLTNLNFPAFSGNTSGDCIQDLWIQYLEGCDGTVTIHDNLYGSSGLSANTFYGDSSNLRVGISNIYPMCSQLTPDIAFLNYGVNIISAATTTDHCVRLPENPIIGLTSTIINNSGFDIFVFPSAGQNLPTLYGGSIDGKVNGSYKTASVMIPSDSNSYTFYCYDDQNGGRWSSNISQSTNQFDSGVISMDTSTGGTFICAWDNNYKNIGDAGNYAWNAVNTSLNLSNYIYNPDPLSCSGSSGLCATVFFKPTVPWQFINKVTLYTNFSTGLTASGAYFGLINAYERCYYSAGTVTSTGYRGWNGGGNVGSPSINGIDQIIAGNTLGSPYTPNPGDPGTWWGELTYSSTTRPSMIGDFLLSSGTMYLGMPVNANVDSDLYYSQYIGFIFETDQISSDVKFRFLIDYTI